MIALLDTHTFLWFITGDRSISKRAREIIDTPSNRPLLSIASLWEIAIKVSIGKLTLHKEYDDMMTEQLSHNGIELLPIDFAHLTAVSKLPLHHRDPFDRLIIAQAMSENIPLVSADVAFDAYDITRIW
jgi:PIN domain nuclease of toxin-antitoxin system